MTSKNMREDPLFMRNGFIGTGKYDIPVVKKQVLNLDNLRLISCADTRRNDNKENKECGVHFFVDDYRFKGIYKNPDRTLAKYSQYAFLLTPDFSLYAEMPIWKQIENVAKNRWVGAYWQEKKLIAIPTISWSTPISYSFCFNGAERNSTVAIGMIGCKNNKMAFLHGYDAMLDVLDPEIIIVFGTPFSEMRGNIISIDYLKSRKVVR